MTVDELRALVLSIDGAVESSHHGAPDFRKKNKIVVNLDEDAATITIKLSLADQAALMARSDPAFSLPGGWARHGWTTISLHDCDADEIRELITDSWDQM